MSSNISNKDQKHWAEFIDSKDKLFDKDEKNNLTKHQKTRKIDLHGYTLDESNKIIENFINEAFLAKVNKLVVITGKGLHSENEKDPYISKDLGILKNSVPNFIMNNKELMKMISEIKSASIEDGGSGAFYIFLKKKIKEKV